MIGFVPSPGENIFRDVTTDPVTGKPHKVKACRGLQFDDDPPIQVADEPLMHVRLSVRNGVKEALVRGHDSDRLYLVTNTEVMDLGRIKGDYPGAFGPDGRMHIQADNSRPDYAGEGLHHVEPDGRWVMNNAPDLNRTVTVESPDGPVSIPLVQTDVAGREDVGGYIVGKSDIATNSGVTLIRKSHGQILHYAQYTQHPPRVNTFGWVAIQGSNWQMTPEPDQIPWVKHEDLPERPAPALPAPIQITLGDAPKGLKLWMACETYQAPDPRMVPGNVTWSGHKGKPNKADDPRMFTDRANSGPEWWGDRELAFGLWMSDRGEKPETVDEEIAFTKARGGKAIAIHCDDYEQQRENALAAATRVTNAGLTPILLAHAVEDVDDYELAADYLATQFVTSGMTPWGITFNARTANKDPEKMAGLLRRVMYDLEESPKPSVLLVFGDFLQFEKDWPDAGRLLRELAANLETPALKPGEQPKPVPDTPTPPPPHTDSGRVIRDLPWERPKGSGTGSKVAIGAGLAALIAAVWQAISGKKAS